ncbi:MAG: phosphopantetheine-binding protein [Synergistaceae bacterium]|jgi:acyl carrier protein|nr:phosphopantetheine-binding protein [Synergistaceae bacterium]
MADLSGLEGKIARKIVERLELTDMDADSISEDASLFESVKGEGENIGLDSVDGLELVVLIYEEWGIKVNANDMPNLTTIRRIADYIRKCSGDANK